jgi:spermidine/putrescine transport system substrate-binding protein
MYHRFNTLVACVAGAALACLGSTKSSAAKATTTDSGPLYLYNWSDYIPDSLIKEFETKYGVKVIQSNYDSNAELAAKLKLGGDEQYDVIVPSGSFLANLTQQGLLQKLDHAEIPNAKNLLPVFQNPAYDPGNTY